jgi:photosystem II stability/assembly factor-like uncharacterized protein
MMPTLYVATNGLSVWSSPDLGETIGRLPSTTGMYSGSQVWSLAASPHESGTVYAGTDSGIYRMERDSARWTVVAVLPDVDLVTALAFDPANPDVLLAGTQPAGIHRSDDRGRTWKRLDTGITPYVTSGFYAGDDAATTAVREASPVKHWARVTDIVFDPDDPRIVIAGVEIDGVWRSTDGGHHWKRVEQGLATDDIHGFGVVHDAAGRQRFFAATCDGLHRSDDAGASWHLLPLDSPWQYTRTVRERPDRSGVVFLTNGNGPPGTNGRLYRSRDYGHTWENVALPVAPESSVYFMATHAADPNLVFVATNLGQLFRSVDGGETWSVLPRRLPEVRALVWLPTETS